MRVRQRRRTWQRRCTGLIRKAKMDTCDVTPFSTICRRVICASVSATTLASDLLFLTASPSSSEPLMKLACRERWGERSEVR